MTLITIYQGKAESSWTKTYPAGEEMNWDGHNAYSDRVHRLMEKTRKGDTIVKIVVSKRG